MTLPTAHQQAHQQQRLQGWGAGWLRKGVRGKAVAAMEVLAALAALTRVAAAVPSHSPPKRAFSQPLAILPLMAAQWAVVETVVVA